MARKVVSFAEAGRELVRNGWGQDAASADALCKRMTDAEHTVALLAHIAELLTPISRMAAEQCLKLGLAAAVQRAAEQGQDEEDHARARAGVASHRRFLQSLPSSTYMIDWGLWCIVCDGGNLRDFPLDDPLSWPVERLNGIGPVKARKFREAVRAACGYQAETVTAANADKAAAKKG